MAIREITLTDIATMQSAGITHLAYHVPASRISDTRSYALFWPMRMFSTLALLRPMFIT